MRPPPAGYLVEASPARCTAASSTGATISPYRICITGDGVLNRRFMIAPRIWLSASLFREEFSVRKVYAGVQPGIPHIATEFPPLWTKRNGTP
jgi:hypothetical protein